MTGPDAGRTGADRHGSDATYDALPAGVARAEALAREHGFTSSCTRAVGRLLRTLAATADGPLLELGTGYGVGSAWLLAGARPGVPLVSVDLEAERVRRVARTLAVPDRARFLHGEWRDAIPHGPFGLAFVDVHEAKDDGAEAVVDAVAPGGMLVLDDFEPGPTFEGRPDERWLRWMHHPRLVSCEVRTAADAAVLLAVRRA